MRSGPVNPSACIPREVQSGLTLFETVITIFLISLILTAALLLLGKSADVVRFLEVKSNASDAAEVGLDRMVGEVRGAFNISTPVAGTGSPGVSTLTFSKVDASQENPPGGNGRLPFPLPVPAPAAWPTYQTTFTVNVTYHLDTNTNELIRDVTEGSTGTTTSLPVAEGIQGFAAYFSNTVPESIPNADAQFLVLTLTVQQGEIIYPVSANVVPLVYQ